MTRIPPLFLAALLFACCVPAAAQTRDAPSNPFAADSRPYARWWWFASDIRAEDVRANLVWLKENGFGGAEIAWVYPLNRMRRDTVHYTPRQAWLSPEWTSAVDDARRCADSLGLGCDFTFGTLWPFGDSRVPREEATRRYGDTAWRQDITASWEYPRRGYVVDHLNPVSFRHYAERMAAALPRLASPRLASPRLASPRPAEAADGARRGSCFFVDSWEVETRGLWTPGFETQFRRRFGYDISPFMDSLYTAERAPQRYDYFSLLSDLVVDFYRRFDSTANAAGALSRAQCSGAPCDLLSAYAAVDVPESEAMLYEPPFARIAASAAAVTGAPAVTAESFTCLYGWPRDHLGEEQTADLKLVADALFANGVNHIIWHGMPFNPADIDTVHFYATVHVGSRGALAPEIPAFNAYLEAVSAAMKKGRSWSDLAVYLPTEDAWRAGELPKAQQFIWAWGAYEMRYVEPPAGLRGYNPLWVNREFLERGRVEEGRLRCGEASFSALYIDAAFLDARALARVLALAREGLPVCLARVPEEPGRVATPGYAGMLEALRALPNVAADFHELDLPAPLLTVDAPAAAPAAGDTLPPWWCRRDGDDLYLFVAHPACARLHFPVGYGQSFATDTARVRVTLRYAGRRLPLTLEFPPYASVLLRVRRDGTVENLAPAFTPRVPVVRPRAKVDREAWEPK